MLTIQNRYRSFFLVVKQSGLQLYLSFPVLFNGKVFNQALELHLYCTGVNLHGMFISVFDHLDAQNLFHNKFYFMPPHVLSTCAHHQEVKIALHSLWYHHTYRWPPDDEHMCSKLVEAWNKNLLWNKFCASSWSNTEINIPRCTVNYTACWTSRLTYQ